MTVAPYDHEALWIKAKLFLNHAMDPGDVRPFEERALWASLALELLAKSALSRVSPLLIATPQEDGTNLLIAAGLVSGEARFHSISARTLFERCHKAFKPFNKREALAIAEARNVALRIEALHPVTAAPQLAVLTVPQRASQVGL